MKKVDNLYHFIPKIDSLKSILTEGFKPSYATEKILDRQILIPMVSFSNILLRDAGADEIIHYGNYAVGLSRDWGIKNGTNPVNYTFENGTLDKSAKDFLYNSIFVKSLKKYKEQFKKLHDSKSGPFSKNISLSNTPEEVMKILDYLTLNYNEELFDILSDYATNIYYANWSILSLTKSYSVTDNEGNTFIAYNDREWRKVFPEIDFVFENDPDFDKWTKNTPKPHFNEDEFRLRFNIEDLKVVMVTAEEEKPLIIDLLQKTYGQDLINKLLSTGSLAVDTSENLKKLGY